MCLHFMIAVARVIMEGGTKDGNWAKNGEYVGQSLLTTRAVAELGEAQFCELTRCPPQTNKQNNASHFN